MSATTNKQEQAQATVMLTNKPYKKKNPMEFRKDHFAPEMTTFIDGLDKHADLKDYALTTKEKTRVIAVTNKDRVSKLETRQANLKKMIRNFSAMHRAYCTKNGNFPTSLADITPGKIDIPTTSQANDNNEVAKRNIKNTNCIQAVCESDQKTALWNNGNAHDPGGSWGRGASSQEEQIIYVSNFIYKMCAQLEQDIEAYYKNIANGNKTVVWVSHENNTGNSNATLTKTLPKLPLRLFLDELDKFIKENLKAGLSDQAIAEKFFDTFKFKEFRQLFEKSCIITENILAKNGGYQRPPIKDVCMIADYKAKKHSANSDSNNNSNTSDTAAKDGDRTFHFTTVITLAAVDKRATTSHTDKKDRNNPIYCKKVMYQEAKKAFEFIANPNNNIEHIIGSVPGMGVFGNPAGDMMDAIVAAYVEVAFKQPRLLSLNYDVALMAGDGLFKVVEEHFNQIAHIEPKNLIKDIKSFQENINEDKVSFRVIQLVYKYRALGLVPFPGDTNVLKEEQDFFKGLAAQVTNRKDSSSTEESKASSYLDPQGEKSLYQYITDNIESIKGTKLAEAFLKILPEKHEWRTTLEADAANQSSSILAQQQV